jgi:hypothetical protein
MASHLGSTDDRDPKRPASPAVGCELVAGDKHCAKHRKLASRINLRPFCEAVATQDLRFGTRRNEAKVMINRLSLGPSLVSRLLTLSRRRDVQFPPTSSSAFDKGNFPLPGTDYCPVGERLGVTARLAGDHTTSRVAGGWRGEPTALRAYGRIPVDTTTEEMANGTRQERFRTACLLTPKQTHNSVWEEGCRDSTG